MAVLTIEIVQNRDHDVEIVINDSTGVPVNLTGATVKVAMRLRENEPGNPVKVYSTSPGVGEGTIEMTTPASGLVTVKVLKTHFTSVYLEPGQTEEELVFDVTALLSGGKQIATRDGTDYIHLVRLIPFITAP